MKLSIVGLPYNPSSFEKDYSFFKGQTEGYIKGYIASRYKRNKEKIAVLVNDFTKTFITHESNIYSKPVYYLDWRNEDWIQDRTDAMLDVEKYINLNGKAALWTYKKNSKLKFRALNVRDFVQIDDDFVIVRNGTKVIDEQKMYIFNLWKNKKEYIGYAENWSDVLEIEWAESGSYSVLPFTFWGEPVDTPSFSPLPIIEMVIAGGFGWGDISAQLAFLVQIWGNFNIKDPIWKGVVDAIGLQKAVNIPDATAGGSLNSLKMGDATSQEKWVKHIVDYVKFLCVARGVNPTGWLTPIVGGLSGISRMQELAPLKVVRDSKIPSFRRFDKKNMELLLALKEIKKISKIRYSELSVEATDEQKHKDEKSRIGNILTRYDRGTITKEMMISEIEKITIDEAKIRNNLILKERGLDVSKD